MKLPPLSKFKVDTREEHIILGEELSEYYKKNLYWVAWKYRVKDIKEKFLELKKAGDKEFKHLMQKLK